MFRCLRLLIFVALVGCAPRHFVAQSGDRVNLYLDKPEAVEVLFASSIDGYRLHQAQKDRSGVWLVTGPANREFRYFYRVDGRVHVPDCRYRELDDFGTSSCIHQP